MRSWHFVLRAIGVGFIGLIGLTVLIGILKKNIYDPKVGINILMVSSKGIGIVGIRNGSGYINILDLPDDLVVPILPSKSEFSIETLRKTGLSDKNRLEIMRRSVGEALGVTLPSAIISKGEITPSGFMDSLAVISAETNLSFIDRIRLRSDLSVLMKKGASFELSLPNSVTDKVEEPDGKVLKKFNSAIFSWSRNQWGQDEVMSETPEIAIVNSSKTQGRARIIAKQVETAGGRVIEVSSSPDQVNGCLIYGDKVKHPITYEYLRSSFGCREDLTKGDQITNNSGADIVMIIGDD